MRPLILLWRLFQSRTLALVLLLIIFASMLLASVVPVFSSWWFYLAVGLLLTNTLACTIGRIPPLLRQRKRWSRLEEDRIKGLKNWASVETFHSRPDLSGLFHRRLGEHGYRTVGEPGEGKTFMFARKGDVSQWGSLLFHFSFLVLIVGLVYVQLTRYVGTMVITEGQVVTEQSQDYLNTLRLPLLGMPHQGFQVGLEKFTPTYEKGMTGADYAADLIVLDNGAVIKNQTIRVNQPLNYKGVSFVLYQYGFAPFFELKDETGQEMFSGYVNLRVLNPGSQDFFSVPGTNLTVMTTFYPDMVMREGQPATRSLVPLNPVFSLNVTEEGKEVFKGLLPIGGNVSFEEKSLAFSDLRYWTAYKVVRDPGKDVIFASFWLGLLGLVVRYLVTPKQIWVLVQDIPNGSRITMGGTAPQQDALFAEEFARLVQELTE